MMATPILLHGNIVISIPCFVETGGNLLTMMAIFLPAAYIAGSVNFSVLLFRILGKDDPRYHSSGTAGTTNVYRQAGLFWAGVVFFLDSGRALAASWAALYLLPADYVPWTGLALILGNRFPCFHQFRGGKGVASYLGFTTLISPLSAAFSVLVWLGVYGIFRIPFIASFFMTFVLMVGTIIACGYQTAATAGTIATALFIFYNHRQNVTELFSSRA
jgi:glycerol-3-phosphate acyltransferase PlsY